MVAYVLPEVKSIYLNILTFLSLRAVPLPSQLCPQEPGYYIISNWL